MLTYERAKELFSYSPETGELRWATKASRKVVPGAVAGCITVHGYRQVRVDGKFYKAHRIAWLLRTGEWPEHEIDHANGVRDDNRWVNLREATSAENKQNMARRSDNTSGYTGVIFEKRVKLWEARVVMDGRIYSAGYFDTPEQAADAYAKAKSELHTFQPVTRAA